MEKILSKLDTTENLSRAETFELFQAFLNDTELSDEDIKRYLIYSSKKPPTSEELVGAAESLRKHMLKVDLVEDCKSVLDTCGTGGSGLSAFNTSTVVALILAASGAYVAKHGNRAVSSKCGSADVLEALGVKINLGPEAVKSCLEKTNFAFIFAPNFHPATKRVQGIRKSLGLKTIFNYLGPLINPAGVKTQLLGVSNQEMLVPMAETLLKLSSIRALVVCGEDGLDEITLTGKTKYCEIKDGKLIRGEFDPRDISLNYVSQEELTGFAPMQSAEFILNMLAGEKSSRRDLVLINAAAGLYLLDKASSLKEGFLLAEEIIESKKPLAILESVIKETNRNE